MIDYGSGAVRALASQEVPADLQAHRCNLWAAEGCDVSSPLGRPCGREVENGFGAGGAALSGEMVVAQRSLFHPSADCFEASIAQVSVAGGSSLWSADSQARSEVC